MFIILSSSEVIADYCNNAQFRDGDSQILYTSANRSQARSRGSVNLPLYRDVCLPGVAARVAFRRRRECKNDE